MNAPQSSDHANDRLSPSPGFCLPGPQDDLLVAKVGDNAFAMMPSARWAVLPRVRLAASWADGAVDPLRLL